MPGLNTRKHKRRCRNAPHSGRIDKTSDQTDIYIMRTARSDLHRAPGERPGTIRSLKRSVTLSLLHHLDDKTGGMAK